MEVTKQTAVEWFYDKIKSHFEHDGDLLEGLTFTYAIAKQKEKQQIIDTWCDGNDSEPKEVTGEFAEDYYKKKYGKANQ